MRLITIIIFHLPHELPSCHFLQYFLTKIMHMYCIYLNQITYPAVFCKGNKVIEALLLPYSFHGCHIDIIYDRVLIVPRWVGSMFLENWFLSTCNSDVCT
jgi:hypothetical protein